ncbi:hypothetical protein [Nonomuraea turcica]|uniref:hypothetical protein n=1 Tax=Nonomuraea sp. G32 TaxID=3067274 RepID=UPI00273C84A3|nr:hypothetical protein [Nonomuraea sp. G32]MDP4500498.1 hypothetical protein [Nonomuraea sp. G32]
MTVRIDPVKDWLKAKREMNALHLALMALRYDLDGALKSGQTGLAWWTQHNMLLKAIRLRVLEAGAEVREVSDRLEQAFASLEALDRMNPALCATAWKLWLRPEPPASTLHIELDRTFQFIESDLKLSWALSRARAVMQWASSTKVLRTIARQLNIAQSDDWYLSSSSAPDLDWYSEILEMFEQERSS